jgi:1,2-diacylglycerol 3-alpha-glucosyltransferase
VCEKRNRQRRAGIDGRRLLQGVPPDEAIAGPAGPASKLRIAVASSGLGHVRRGIESWAQDLAAALQRFGMVTTLFGGGDNEPGVTVVPCFRRGNPTARHVARFFRPLGGWRFGMGSVYEVEQTSFALRLWPMIRQGYDILHVQDPLVARILDYQQRRGLSHARVILGNGTAEQPVRLTGLSVVQELSPQGAAGWTTAAVTGPKLFMVPNFIDMSTFAPGDRTAARRQLDLPEDALLVICCAAIRRFHKRIDYLLEEFAAFATRYDRPAILVIAGGLEQDTDELMALGQRLLGERVRFLVSAPRATMRVLYRAADVFALASLFEAGSIALIEAMSAGLPVVCHDTPNFRFAAGPMSRYADLAQRGAMAEALMDLTQPGRRERLAKAARAYAEATFSERIVIQKITDMYTNVTSGI